MNFNRQIFLPSDWHSFENQSRVFSRVSFSIFLVDCLAFSKIIEIILTKSVHIIWIVAKRFACIEYWTLFVVCLFKNWTEMEKIVWHSYICFIQNFRYFNLLLFIRIWTVLHGRSVKEEKRSNHKRLLSVNFYLSNIWKSDIWLWAISLMQI